METRLPNICLQVRKVSARETPQKKSGNDEAEGQRSLSVYSDSNRKHHMYTLFPLLCPAGLSDLQTDGKQSDSREPSSPSSSSESVGPPEQPGASNAPS